MSSLWNTVMLTLDILVRTLIILSGLMEERTNNSNTISMVLAGIMSDSSSSVKSHWNTSTLLGSYDLCSYRNNDHTLLTIVPGVTQYILILLLWRYVELYQWKLVEMSKTLDLIYKPKKLIKLLVQLKHNRFMVIVKFLISQIIGILMWWLWENCQSIQRIVLQLEQNYPSN